MVTVKFVKSDFQ
jgi:hypothetical protein